METMHHAFQNATSTYSQLSLENWNGRHRLSGNNSKFNVHISITKSILNRSSLRKHANFWYFTSDFSLSLSLAPHQCQNSYLWLLLYYHCNYGQIVNIELPFFGSTWPNKVSLHFQNDDTIMSKWYLRPLLCLALAMVLAMRYIWYGRCHRYMLRNKNFQQLKLARSFLSVSNLA